MKIISLKNKSKKVSDFRHREWELIHTNHFGSTQDPDKWKKRNFIYKGVEGKEIVGVIQGDFVAGVMYIDQLLVKSGLRGKGVGKELMEKAEDLAKENGVHKIYLKTGIDWEAVRFYNSLGYDTEGIIKNFYEHKDFRIMSKEI